MIRPLFPFYGSKWRDARRYPAPSNHVIEPFAGSAGYSLCWEPERVQLFDVDPIIVGVWQYLIGASQREVMALPDLEVGQSVDELNVSQEAARSTPESWPTPNQRDWKDTGPSQGNRKSPNLGTAVHLWPTPKSSPSGPDFARMNRPRSGGGRSADGDCPDPERPTQPGLGGVVDGISRGLDGRWVEPDIPRVALKVPDCNNRLKALGNALVPQISEWIGHRVVAFENAHEFDLGEARHEG